MVTTTYNYLVTANCNETQLSEVTPKIYELRHLGGYITTLSLKQLINLNEILNDILHKSEEKDI